MGAYKLGGGEGGGGRPITKGAYDLGVGAGGRREAEWGREPITDGVYDLG